MFKNLFDLTTNYSHAAKIVIIIPSEPKGIDFEVYKFSVKSMLMANN